MHATNKGQDSRPDSVVEFALTRVLPAGILPRILPEEVQRVALTMLSLDPFQVPMDYPRDAY